MGLCSRVAKGGSYTHGQAFLDPEKRQDYYSLEGHERLAYMGFRVAAGAMKPSFTSSNGGHVSDVSLSMVASTSDIRHFLNTTDFRVVFVDQVSGFWKLSNQPLTHRCKQ